MRRPSACPRSPVRLAPYAAEQDSSSEILHHDRLPLYGVEARG